MTLSLWPWHANAYASNCSTRCGKIPEIRLVRQGFAPGFGRKPDEKYADNIDQAHRRTGQRIAARPGAPQEFEVLAEKAHQVSRLKCADSGEDAAEIKAEALASRTNIGGKQLRQVQR